MATTCLAYPDLALGKLSSTNPDYDAEPFVQLSERKVKRTRRCKTIDQVYLPEEGKFFA